MNASTGPSRRLQLVECLGARRSPPPCHEEGVLAPILGTIRAPNRRTEGATGTEEWVELEFDKRSKISGVEVYWFDDTGIGQCRVPASWGLEVKVEDHWKPVSSKKSLGVEKDRYNRATFDPVEASGLRLKVQFRERFSSGIHELRVLGEKK